MAAIQDLLEQWEGHSGLEVEEFLKAQISGKIGYYCWSDEIDSSNFYHLWGFASEEDYLAYHSDPEGSAELLLVDVALPISTVQGDSYGSYLFTSANQAANAVVMDPEFNVNLRFHAVRNTNGERLNMGTKGTLQVQRSLDNGSTWNTVGTIPGAIDSTDYSNTTTYTQIDFGKYLQKGYRQLIRVRASFVYTDNDQERTAYSTWVNIASSITYTELSLECLLNWNNAMQASQIRSIGFPISYLVNGLVAKTLHVEIEGQTTLEATFSLSAAENGTTFSRDIADSSDTYKIFDHGVHKVRARLSASDGLGGTLYSDWVENSFMIIDYATAGANADKPYLMLQGVRSRVSNYVQTEICGYAVFNPTVSGNVITAGDEPIDITFYLTSYSENFPSGEYTKYFESNSLVTPNVRNTLTTTIEIESESTSDIQTYFRVWRKDGNTMSNFLQESTGSRYIGIEVDNSDNFSPALGASFILNPKVRNNTESSPMRILNSADNNAVVTSDWQGFDMRSDGWVEDSAGIKVLRILAGERLTISLNPFAQFRTSPDSAMTMEFDLSVKNVTNEDDPILKILESVAGNPRGLSIKPMEGNIYTKSNIIDSETNFRFCEDKRTHISINIHNAIRPNVNGDGLYDPNAYTPAQSIALVRVFINGNIEREVEFSTSANDEFCTGAMSNGGIVIGQDGADIDIYGIRIYANRQLTSPDIVKNYIATLPTSEEKRNTRTQNDIMTGGRVDAEKVKALGKRVLILHGAEPYFFRTSVASVWWEIFQYNADGSLNNDLSGTICKETGMAPKRQGSTANTYYYSNIQTKIDDGGTITIPVSTIHSSIHVSAPRTSNGQTVVGIYGGNLGAKDPVENEEKEYPYDNGMVTVPDGWIDGNGKYRGMGFMITDGTPLATKLVLKVNYASSMQSHLCAGTRLYNDLHTKVVGKNSLQQAVPTARVSKYTEPVYFFTQDGDNAPVFRGGGNFGAGKMDKPTWGYVKSLHPMFTMIEGSDNNYPLTDMRVPFITDIRCSEAVTYSAEDEGYFYNGLQSLDFDGGKTSNDIPVNDIRDRLAETWNFIYLHTPMIRYYAGTFQAFLLSEESSNTTYKYWCVDGADAYKLKRYNYVTGTWVDAGLWTYGSGYAAIDIRTDAMTAATYNASTHKADYAELNKEIIGAIAAHAKKYIGFYFNVDSLKFHYVFQNHFMAGTDNCSKNTYYVIDPTAKSVTIDGETRSCYLWELHQDDVDTILITDNNGRSTKPYYIDRMHPFNDKDTSENRTSCYEGTQNGLFNLVEAMWEESKELQSTLKATFNAMVSLVTVSDNARGWTSSIWGCLQKYFFTIQRDFYCQTAYNEQARIRYEWPALLGFISGGSGARSIPPITQSMGSQLEAETQFMLRRVVYMASYAAWGNLYDGGKTYNIGIADTADTFSMQAFHLPPYQSNTNNYTFRVTPHQYIYPTGMLGQTSVDPHVRVAPGETFALNLGDTESNDTGLSVLGANYYRSFGNVGDISVAPGVSFTVNGKRLVEFVAEPTTTYTENGKTVGAFRPNQIAFSAAQLKTISLNGSGVGGALIITQLNRLVSIDVRGTYMNDVTLPSSKILTTVKLPRATVNLRLSNLPNLSTFVLEGAQNLEVFEIGEGISYNVYQILSQCYTDNAPLERLVVSDVNWQNVGLAVLNYMATVEDCQVTGSVSIYEPSAGSSVVNFESKLAMVQKWGNIDSPSNPLHITYNIIATTSVILTGDYYLHTTGEHQYTAAPSNPNCNDVTGILWAFGANTYGITIDQNGLLTAPAIAPSAEFVTLTYTYNRLNDEPLVITRNVGIYNRPAAVGDYVYYDGTYLDFWDDRKTVIGMCFYVNPDLPSDRRMVSMRRLIVNDNGNDNDCVGIGTDYFPDLVLANGEDPYLTGIPATNAGTTSINAANILDETQPDGYKRYDENTFFGDIAPMVAVSDFEDVHAGDVVSRGKYYTHLFIEHRNMVLSNVTPTLPIPAGTTEKTEYARLEELIAAVKAANDNTDKYRQFYYPAASRCYAYEPSVRYSESLANKFKAHKWWLPSIGELVRIQWLLNTNRTGNFAEAYTAGRLDDNGTSGGYNGIWSSTRGTSTNHEAQTRGNTVYSSGNDARVGLAGSRIRPVTCF